MTDLASGDAPPTAPAPDETTSSAPQHRNGEVAAPEHGSLRIDTVHSNPADNDGDNDSSGSELTPVQSDEFEENPFDDASFQQAAPAADHGDATPEIDERPIKRRRVRDATPPPTGQRKPNPISPPWKKFEAEGPTTLIEDGKRRSGRVSTLFTEPQPSPAVKRPARGNVPNHNAHKDRQTAAAKTNGHLKSLPKGKGTNSKTALSKQNTKKAVNGASRPAPRTSNRRRPSSSPPTRRTSPRRASTRMRRSSRNRRNSFEALDNDGEDDSDSQPTKIRLRLRSTNIPLVHPLQVNVLPGQTVARPKLGSSFEDYLQKAPTIDVKDGGWQDPTEDGPPYTAEQAEKDAQILVRVEGETRPGGLLSEDYCSAFVPEPTEEPPRQWAHMDHLVKAAVNFRKLMVMEQQRHRATARRLAEACRDAWLRRQPKTAEQIEAEAREAWIVKYKMVVKAVAGTWENVRLEINRRRLEEWEAAEQKRVKAALNEAVNMSELKLQARRAHFDSEGISDEEDISDEDDASDDEDDLDDEMDDVDEEEMLSEDSGPGENLGQDEDNMSSSGDEEDAKSEISDAQLTQEQLRAKYANIPELPPAKEDTGITNGDHALPDEDVEMVHDNDTSDESVDMDDDMGSSEEDMESGDDDEDASDDGEEETAGLLGMLFGKSEIDKFKTEAPPAEESTPAKDSPPAEESDTVENPRPTDDVTMTDLTPVTNGEAAVALNGTYAEEEGNEATPVTRKLDQESESSEQVKPPKDPLQANAPDALATIPEPLNAENVGKELIKAVEKTNSIVTDLTKVGSAEETSAIPSVEVTVAPDGANVSPGTDAITNSASRDPSQSPRTSDTKATDVDTVSSGVRSGASRSMSPMAHSPKTEVPFLLRGNLREYQHYGLDWLAGLYRNKTNGILADEMGLGKTIQTIALLAHLACHHEVWGPHLVIVPTSVMLNWEMEFKKWCPGFKVLSYYGSIEERKRKRQGWKTDDMWNVCITSYQIVLQDQQVFKRRQWHYMILDEAHNIKNFKSKRWQTLLTFNTQARLLLTGTPLQNNLTELWSLLFFLMPSENGVGGFADLAEFQDWFHKPESQILESGREQMDDEARAIIAKLHKVLRPYLLRRLKADVEKQMPAKYEHVEFCRLSRRQRELYDGFLARTDTREALSSGNYISVINCLMQLRKVCNHPDLFVERPIMTSFCQHKAVVGDYEFTNRLVQDKLCPPEPMKTVNLDFLNLVPAQYESLSADVCDRVAQLSSHRALMELREAQKKRAQSAYSNLDPSAVESNIVYLESAARWGRYEELQHCVYLNAIRRQQRPVYGTKLRDFLTIGVNERPRKPRPKVPAKIMAWFEEQSPVLESMVLDLDQRAASMKPAISKFACITPAVITRDVDRFVLGSRGVNSFNEENLRLAAPIRYAPFMPKEPPADPWHEARMRLSIQFPDKRLLQYDCGKLQALDRLLRKLQSGGHRALIFTQMTKVLDILEQFLSIHGHKYLRLDGATKVEQRQILTDRFNNDNRILAFILSTRSGGLGINLTGADTVIFYDQDWNPAMDKQCQDRCHRIGQTRDVHIYRLISEHTIEANILRKASQKQMLDDVVIQEGGFTTDYFNKVTVQDVMKDVVDNAVEDVVGDAMDRVLGGTESAGERAVGRVLEQAEDREDVAAAHVAEKEIQEDEADFDEKAPTASASGSSSARQGSPATRDASAAPGVGRSNLGLYEQSAEQAEVELNAWGEPIRNIDECMLSAMARMLEGTPLELPRDKKKSKSKKGKDTRKR